MNINNPLSHRNKEPERSVLYIVGTPIGNLDDISIRAINILKNVSLIACEDTRKTGRLLKHINISNKLVSFNEYNSMKKLDYLISLLQKGESLAVVSDAGMPLISDPGESMVKRVKDNNLDVICIPGPCAAITALVSSGLETSKFTFYGFLPKTNVDRKLLLKEITENDKTSIIYESPKRITRLLTELKELCGGDKRLVLLKELTKRYERHFGDKIDLVLDQIKAIEPKGEYTLIISGNKKDKNDNLITNENLIIDLQNLIKAGLSHSAASNYLSKKTGLPKNQIYKLII
tara:strand:+ start:1430 stop:2299 length:870 start_codon:yes stop_codon:yes gene_type:complete